MDQFEKSGWIMSKRLSTSRYITGFDGIRTLAVIGVILYHLLPTQMRGGYLGVPVFFVVSGYLITDLLRQEWDQNGKIKVIDFYVRRMKRLYPGMVVMLGLAAAYITLFQRNLLNNLRGVVVSSLLYYNNWWQINHGLSYFDRFGNESPFTHLWSLAVEGQNYLIWPLVFILLMKIGKKRSRVFNVVAGITVYSVRSVVYAGGGSNEGLLWNRYPFVLYLDGECAGFYLANDSLEKRNSYQGQTNIESVRDRFAAGVGVRLLLAG